MRLKITGSIWLKSEIERSQIVEKVCDALVDFYGTSRLGNPKNPVSDLVFIIVSNKTASEMAKLTFRRIKEEFKGWDNLIKSRGNQRKLRMLLRPAGLSRIKSKQIWYSLNKIKKDFGRCSLQTIKRKEDAEVHNYLTALPGVSDKVAKCVMMYTMGRQVLPVDAHVHRVTRRLGWTYRKRADQSHEELEALVKPEQRYNFHVNCIQHGRSICLSEIPLCKLCPINQYCEYYANIVTL